MPTIQPAELWQESGRWGKYGPELLRFKIGTTASSPMAPRMRRSSPILLGGIAQLQAATGQFYQIQFKFRDEIRPRFGVMRAREFLMKDAYSFHVDEPSLARAIAPCSTRTHASLPAWD